MSEGEAFEAGGGREKDPAEQEALARDLGEELTEVFVSYVRGSVDFAELTFLTFETLQDLHIVASGAYELDEEDDTSDDSSDDEESGTDGADGQGGEEAEYDVEAATEEQEDLAQEPSRS
jgi:hypothetical protein